jgi:isocitrate lyase
VCFFNKLTGDYPFTFGVTSSSSDRSFLSLPIIFNNNTSNGYSDVYYTSMQYHDQKPTFGDEIKIALPLTMFAHNSSPKFVYKLMLFNLVINGICIYIRLHVLFTFYHISCKIVYDESTKKILNVSSQLFDIII